ncbi:MAG TPA: hypothetical protein VFN55_19220 [Solirubrobacteraceae bacterium]|nr:hypothetical protein [Solirubrobacteraceae bacterium]
MPTFCRHNHLVSNCTICAREQNVELRPVVTGGSATEAASAPRPARPVAERSAPRARRGGPRAGGRSGSGMTVRRMARGAEDGYHSDLVPGLRASSDAQRLAEEIAFAQARLDTIAQYAPGLWSEIADASGDVEERTWLAFLIALIGPTESEEPFAEIARVRVPWAGGAIPDLSGVSGGVRTSLDQADRTRTVQAYRAWAQRSGSQATAIAGDAAWTPQRRFARAYERLGLPGLQRGARFDLLATLGAAGLYELQAGTLALGASDPVTIAAKRVFGIGDAILLERRAMGLAEGCGVALQVLDVALFNWERGARATLGVPDAEPDPGLTDAVASALGL